MDANGTSFERELTKIQLDLLFFITQLMGKPSADNEDILQDVNLALWTRREEYNPARAPLLNWARSLAYYEVMKWRARNLRSKLIFSDETVKAISETLAEEPTAPVDQRLHYLEECLHSMPRKSQKLIVQHHYQNKSLEEIALSSGRSSHALASALYKLRDALRKCIEGKIHSKEHYA